MSLSVDNKAIKIPTHHYVGFSKRETENIPLGFMTPDGTDAAAIKRKKTVDDWATSSSYQTVKLPAKSFENKPLSGFKLGNNVRHGYGWGQGNVKWRIEDPRGFELEISSPNLAQIIAITTIENGEILEKCVWARMGAENILLPVNSDVYETAQANTERANTSVSLKDLKIGYKAILQNGKEGRYMGQMYALNKNNEEHIVQAPKKTHVFLNETEVFTVATPKLSSIEPDTELQLGQAEIALNKAIRDPSINTGWSCVGYSAMPLFTADKPLRYNLVPVKNPASLDGSSGHISAKIGDIYAFGSIYKFHYREEIEASVYDYAAYLVDGKIRYLTDYNNPSLDKYRQQSGWRRTYLTLDLSDPDIEWFVHQATFDGIDGPITVSI